MTERLPAINEKKATAKWIENDTEKQFEETNNGGAAVQVHVDKHMQDVLKGADQEREKELKELREKARKEEQEEVESLLSKPQPAVPQGWDFLTLPRNINLMRVKTPPTIM